MKLSLRAVALAAGATVLIGAAPSTVLAATTKSVVYYKGIGAHLIDWQPKNRARVVTGAGVRSGSVLDNGTQRLITLDSPFSAVQAWGTDECGDYEERHDTMQLVVRDLTGGVSQIAEIGADVVVGGCRNGESTPFGSPDDEGASARRLSMAARPPMTDLVPGLQLAGPGEQVWALDYPSPSQDVVVVQANAATFQATGNTYPATIDATGWWVFDLTGAQRAYTRLELDARTGGETWLTAEWAGGQAQRVATQSFVKPLAGAGFGTVAQASRMWQSGLTVGANNPFANTPFYFYLYKNGTGEQVSKVLDAGTETRLPITWSFDGLDILHERITAGGALVQTRRWVPLRNEGSRRRWVLESTEYRVDGETFPGILPRVNYYLDTGKAVPTYSARSR